MNLLKQWECVLFTKILTKNEARTTPPSDRWFSAPKSAQPPFGSRACFPLDLFTAGTLGARIRRLQRARSASSF